MNLELKKAKRLLILGATRGIGLAFVQHISHHYPHIEIHAVHRKSSDLEKLKQVSKIKLYEIDVFNEEQIKNTLSEVSEFDIFINTVGVLHTSEIAPEKSLRDFNVEHSLEQFKVNALLTPLWAKYIRNYLPKDRASLFLCLSAKVGSIQDNHIGGWYSYRSSKSALNMLLKNISIEFKRSRIPAQVVAVHPGTTITELSKPFIENTPYQLWEPSETVENIFKALRGIGDESGVFLDWKGGFLPW